MVLLSANITHTSKTSWDPAAVLMMCYLVQHNKMLLCKSNSNIKMKFVISSTTIQGNNSQTTFKHLAPHSSKLAWRIPGTREPGGLPSMGLHRVGHDWSDLAICAVYFSGIWLSGEESTWQCRSLRFDPWVTKMPWRRKWELTPVFLPGKSHGQWSLAGYSP